MVQIFSEHKKSRKKVGNRSSIKFKDGMKESFFVCTISRVDILSACWNEGDVQFLGSQLYP